VIFNISAVLSCHAAVQNRSDDNGLKTAYHSFQASAGMFTYINENFLHAPSTDLSRDTVKTLIHIMLAQGQEVFLEKQIRDGKKSGLLAKLASQAHFLYSQAKEGLEAEFAKSVFDSSWTKFVQVKTAHTSSLAEYYQALADDDTGLHGSAIARLQVADKSSKLAFSLAKSFPSSPPATSNLGSDTNSNLQAITKRQMENVQEKLSASIKDNDFIYHQSVPAEASLSPVAKFPASKAIPVSELYQGQDIQRIIGPDIFQKIVPMSVTESASMYDEEKAKLVRSETEKVEQANSEMAASLDYLKLPSSLNVIKGGMDQEMAVDPEFERWCTELSSHEPFSKAFEHLQRDKTAVLESLAKSSKQLDMEESVCEKMRSKYGGEWTQQPSSRLTSTLRSDIKSYRDTVDEAAVSDSQLLATARQYESDFEEMRSAGQTDEADVLYQQALIKAGSGIGKGKTKGPSEGNLLDEDYGEGGPSIADQIAKVEDLLKRLNLVKRERQQVLKDLKEKVLADDISNVLILNKKSIANHENQLFQAELEKFRSHQNRLISTVHKQSSLLKDLTKTYGELLQDRRVRLEKQKYEIVQKSRSTVLSRYKRIFNAHEDLIQGLMRAQGFYSEMKESVESLEKNVDSFVNNRRAEGASLLNQIEQNKSNSASGEAAAERDRIQQLMGRLSMEPSASSPPTRHQPPPLQAQSTYGAKNPPPVPAQYPTVNADPRFTIPPREPPAPPIANGFSSSAQPPSQPQQPQYQQPQRSPVSPDPAIAQGAAHPINQPYNPMAYPERSSSRSQPQSTFSSTPQAAPPAQTSLYPQSQVPQPRPQSQILQPQTQHQSQSQAHYNSVQQLNFTSSTQSPYRHTSPHPLQQHPSQSRSQSRSQQHHQSVMSPPTQTQYQQPFQQYNMPSNYVPPPPPPGPPGGGSQTQYPPNVQGVWPSGPGGYAGSGYLGSRGQGQQQQQQQQQQGSGVDPWAGLNAWK
jgi:BRO1-like domain/ALIX V-shaped domain binding to HIV